MKDSFKNFILQKITGLSKEQLFLNPPPNPLPGKEGEEYEEYITRLNAWEPIEYILEKAEFYGRDFYVDNRVLIPRNDTEVMVDRVILEQADIYIDVWTGSWCIPISVVKNSKNNFTKTYALDISDQALKVAQKNIHTHNLEKQITLLQWDLLEPIIPLITKGNLGVVITANLPYIKQDDFDSMDSSVYLNEPKLALYWGKNTGFELYEKLIWQCQELVKSWNKIILFIELGFDQKDVCEDFLQSHNLKYKVFQDNGGVDRCVRVKI